MTSLYDASREDIAGLLSGQPAFRLKQVWEGLYTQFAEPSQILTLPGAVREELTKGFPNSLNLTTASVSDKGDTIKFLWSLADGGHPIETVLMHYKERATVCVSTQAGCAMACGFCATGQAGFTRHLSVGEIVEQVVYAARESAKRKQRLANVVFMAWVNHLLTKKRCGAQ